MKRYVSVFEMIARSSFYKVLLVLAGMVTAEAVSFYLTMVHPAGLSVEEYIAQSKFCLFFEIAYILITVIVVLPGMNIGSTQSYTLQRLRIKEKRIFWLQSLYNLLAYILLWGIQLVVILVCIIVYQKHLPEGGVMTNQTMFLAFYRSDFLHSVLPLEDGPGWWVLGLIGVTTAFVAAEFTKLQRDGKFGFELLLLLVSVLITFPRALGYEITFEIVAFSIVYMIMGMRWLLNVVGEE